MERRLEKVLKAHGGVLRTADAVQAGLSRVELAASLKVGELERVAHGVYVRSGELHDEMFVLQVRSSRLVFSHETALWLNGLSDRAPLVYHVTIPTGAPLGAVLRGDCQCHYVKPELFEAGVVSRKTEFGNEVRCYNAERTLCDMVRHESKVGVEALVGGLRAYAARRDKDIAALMNMAERFSVALKMSRYMGVLV